ncbi:MAG: PrsW family intramembrane metalloprotease, partial [Ruminococcus sp.]|nr:PrsW family intramembrane metalloprotease [Ruminococcus sp.]
LLSSWWSKEFNYTYDAVVYAVSVSLGFAALENILYVFDGGFSTAILRALTSVPGHTLFAVFMGYHYGIAKKAFCSKKVGLTIVSFCISLILPILIHGFYDFCLFMQNWLFIFIFLGFDVILTVLGFLVVNKLSREDSPVNAPAEPPVYTGMRR